VAEVLQGQFPHLKLAHGHAREVLRVRVALALQDVPEDGGAIDIVVATKEDTNQEELAKAVDYVQHFYEQVQDD